ncbi:MAG: polysaccharide deacetylase family protein [Patescibacteria group bacterium]
MRNYRRYTSASGHIVGRSRGTPPDRSRLVVGIVIVGLILLFVAYLRTGKKATPATTSNTNVSTNVAVSVPRAAGLSTAACPSILDRANTTEKAVALTLDIGTVPGDLSKTLPAAKTAGVPVAFFITGKLVENDKAAVESIRDAGFPIYNHSYDNLRFSKLTTKEVQAQLQATDDLIRSVTNVSTKPYARLPFGDSSAEAISAMRAAGYCALTWTVDGLDISSTATVQSVTQRVQTYIKPGGIILLHAGSDLAYAAIPEVVRTLQAQGYRFVALDDLFRIAAPISTNTNTATANTNTPASQE